MNSIKSIDAGAIDNRSPKSASERSRTSMKTALPSLVSEVALYLVVSTVLLVSVYFINGLSY